MTRRIKWEVFPNSDGDEGGWFSYVESETAYVGGALHRTKKEAEAHARALAASARNQKEVTS